MRYENVWTFNTARFQISLDIAVDLGYQYDGDDEDGETQAKLESGEYVAFDSRIQVTLDGRVIGEDHLGGSVYAAATIADFWSAHRERNPMNRNCSIYRDTMRAQTGHECVICHYFPDMVRNAIAEARATLCAAPRIRCAA